MIKIRNFLLMCVLAFLLTGCLDDAAQALTILEESNEQRPLTIAERLTSESMRQLEQRHAVSPEQERYLAFGAILLTNNRQSSRILELYGVSRRDAADLIRGSWGIVCRETALTQLRNVASGNQQSLVADDIFHAIVRRTIAERAAVFYDLGIIEVFTDFVVFETFDAVEIFENQTDLSGLENVLSVSFTRATRRMHSFYDFFEMLEENNAGLEVEEAFELYVLLEFTDRINRGLSAYQSARIGLLNTHGFTVEELRNIQTLAAWDYGRAVFVARYSIAAGHLNPDDVWPYLQMAAKNAARTYSCFREFTAAYVLGRALAFGNSSVDMTRAIEFLLTHEESPFLSVSFR